MTVEVNTCTLYKGIQCNSLQSNKEFAGLDGQRHQAPGQFKTQFYAQNRDKIQIQIQYNISTNSKTNAQLKGYIVKFETKCPTDANCHHHHRKDPRIMYQGLNRSPWGMKKRKMREWFPASKQLT